MEKKIEKNTNERRYRVLVFGGFEKVTRELVALLPDCELRFVLATRRAVDMSGIECYELVAGFSNRCSHSSFDFVFAKARKHNVRALKLYEKGAKRSAAEIMRALS